MFIIFLYLKIQSLSPPSQKEFTFKYIQYGFEKHFKNMILEGNLKKADISKEKEQVIHPQKEGYQMTESLCQKLPQALFKRYKIRIITCQQDVFPKLIHQDIFKTYDTDCLGIIIENQTKNTTPLLLFQDNNKNYIVNLNNHALEIIDIIGEKGLKSLNKKKFKIKNIKEKRLLASHLYPSDNFILLTLILRDIKELNTHPLDVFNFDTPHPFINLPRRYSATTPYPSLLADIQNEVLSLTEKDELTLLPQKEFDKIWLKNDISKKWEESSSKQEKINSFLEKMNIDWNILVLYDQLDHASFNDQGFLRMPLRQKELEKELPLSHLTRKDFCQQILISRPLPPKQNLIENTWEEPNKLNFFGIMPQQYWHKQNILKTTLKKLISHCSEEKDSLIILIDVSMVYDTLLYSLTSELAFELTQNKKIHILEVSMKEYHFIKDQLKLTEKQSKQYHTLKKNNPSFLEQTNTLNQFQQLFNKLKPKKVFIWGVYTNMCLLQSIQDLLNCFPKIPTLYTSFMLSQGWERFDFWPPIFSKWIQSGKLTPIDLSLFDHLTIKKELKKVTPYDKQNIWRYHPRGEFPLLIKNNTTPSSLEEYLIFELKNLSKIQEEWKLNHIPPPKDIFNKTIRSPQTIDFKEWTHLRIFDPYQTKNIISQLGSSQLQIIFLNSIDGFDSLRYIVQSQSKKYLFFSKIHLFHCDPTHFEIIPQINQIAHTLQIIAIGIESNSHINILSQFKKGIPLSDFLHSGEELSETHHIQSCLSYIEVLISCLHLSIYPFDLNLNDTLIYLDKSDQAHFTYIWNLQKLNRHSNYCVYLKELKSFLKNRHQIDLLNLNTETPHTRLADIFQKEEKNIQLLLDKKWIFEKEEVEKILTSLHTHLKSLEQEIIFKTTPILKKNNSLNNLTHTIFA